MRRQGRCVRRIGKMLFLCPVNTASLSVLSERLQCQENFVFFFEQSFRYIIIRKFFPVQAHAPAAGFPVIRILDPDMEMFSPEIFVNFEGIPALGDSRPRSGSLPDPAGVRGFPLRSRPSRWRQFPSASVRGSGRNGCLPVLR